jgi:hypothetical protein
MHQGSFVPGEDNLNGIDAAWKQLKSFFKPKKRDGPLPGQEQGMPMSAVPTRLKDSSKGTSSAPSSPASRRKAEMEAQMMRSSSAPEPGIAGIESNDGDGTPAIFALVNPLIQMYAPMLAPYAEQGQKWYEQFRDGDQKSFWLTHAFFALVVLYLLSSFLIFAFKLFVFTVVMYSTGWTVHTSELLHNETVRKYAYIATGLIGLYLFALMN